MPHRSLWTLLSVLVIAACARGATPAATVGGEVAHESAARAAAAAYRQGSDVVVLRDGAELRAPASAVEADASRLIRGSAGSSPDQEVFAAIDAGCRVNDIVELGQATDPESAVIQAAAVAGVTPAAVYHAATQIRDARTSGDATRLVAAYVLCQYAAARA